MTGPAARRDASAGPTARERKVARGLLLAVVAAYLLVQFMLFSFDRAPRWDESVYLSQVTPGTKAQFMSAFRARGITLLIAPVTFWGGSVEAVRIFLAAVSAVALTGAFWVWIPFVGVAAPLAALLFGFSWMGLLNGSEIFPNILAALLGLAVAGLVCRWLAERGRWPIVVASTLLATLGFFRPTEATAVFGALGVYFLVFRRSSWRVLLPIGLGLAVGWLPWVIEMSVRFGGPLNAFDEAGTAHFRLDSVGANVRQYLAFTNGWVFGPEARRIPPAGVLWFAWLIGMAVVALARRVGASAHDAVLLCSLGALVVAAQYVVLLQDRALAPRYLLPAIAFVSVPAAVGVIMLIRGRVPARVAGAIALLLVIPWGAWQAGVADRLEAQEVRYREQFRVLGLALRGLAGGRSCTFFSLHGTAMIDFASGCAGTQVPFPGPTADQLRQLSSGGSTGFVILPRSARANSPLESMTPALIAGSAPKKWIIYEFPPTGI